jgi:predicted RNase H-like HicB family nuclease
MKMSDKYIKIVEWSDEDNCFIGTCPELFYGGCHGDDPKAVFAELCDIIEEMVEIYEQDCKPLPEPMASHDVITALKKAA